MIHLCILSRLFGLSIKDISTTTKTSGALLCAMQCARCTEMKVQSLPPWGLRLVRSRPRTIPVVVTEAGTWEASEGYVCTGSEDQVQFSGSKIGDHHLGAGKCVGRF